MIKECFAAIKLILILLLILSGLYPMILTILGQALFPFQANGSLIHQNQKIIGSLLLGQEFRSSQYFAGRPSVTLYQSDEFFAQQLVRWQEISPQDSNIEDMLYSSASMLDPHISWQSMMAQLPRVAQARGLELASLHQFAEDHGLKNGLVNVLQLNLALDQEWKSDGKKTQS
jgi:K+-transporting ATPase ATPase C chain